MITGPLGYAPLDSFKKDPDASIRFTIDWSVWLGSDTIAGAPVWSVDAGITNVGSSNTTTTATITLSGGVAGTTYKARCRVTTAAGDVDDRTIEILVQER